MKKLTTLILISAFGAATMITSCDEGGDGGNGGKSTETTAEFDNSNFGLYKGVIAGSSGTVRIEINNGGSIAKACIYIDGETDELTCTGTFVKGQAIVNAGFTGNFSSFTFCVDADGKNPVIINIDIEGHEEVMATVSKETSTHVSSCYEGTSTGQNHSGVFNIVRNNNTFSGVSMAVDGFSCSLRGNIGSDGSFSGTAKTKFNGLDVTLTYSGKFSGDNVRGSWANSWDGGTNSGSFSGRKTL